MQQLKRNDCGADDSRILFPRAAAARQRHQIVHGNPCGLMHANPHEVVQALLPDAGWPAAAFDAAVMLHVIEHRPDTAKIARDMPRLCGRARSA